ncbi:MAG: Smr/MutS family protein [Mogibacterium sp.]|nr:Smr/MutS family protein [Mogibacterium sp.]
MSTPIITLDLHGMLREDAVKAIDRALRAADRTTYQIRLVHGFHRGTSLKNMILEEYRYHPKVLRIAPGDNLGVTVLVLREL